MGLGEQKIGTEAMRFIDKVKNGSLEKITQTFWIIVSALGLLALLFIYQALVQHPALSDAIDLLSIFTTIFLGIFIEAAPFLLLGTLASGLVEVFFRQGDFARLSPRNPIMAALFGSIMGFFFPVCECGVVPLARRLFNKGLAPSAGIAFLLASPVVNPIVIASTLAAFGAGRIFYLRIGLSLVIAALTGIIFSFQKEPHRLMRPTTLPMMAPQNSERTAQGISLAPISLPPLKTRLRRAMLISVDEFFEMGRYLVIGALLASILQTIVPQSLLLGLAQGPVISVLALITLAVVLSICSTVDAFIALSFASAFSPGAILGFLVYGPMVDIKSTLMYLQVFRRRTVLYLILLPLLMTVLAGVFINLYLF